MCVCAYACVCVHVCPYTRMPASSMRQSVRREVLPTGKVCDLLAYHFILEDLGEVSD